MCDARRLSPASRADDSCRFSTWGCASLHPRLYAATCSAGWCTEIRKSFDDIYGLRSRLVHGDEKLLDQKTLNHQLRQARSLARRTFVWFLHYLDHVLHETRNNRTLLPAREELLGVLDLKIESRVRIKHLLSILPADCPRPSSWFDSLKESQNHHGEFSDAARSQSLSPQLSLARGKGPRSGRAFFRYSCFLVERD